MSQRGKTRVPGHGLVSEGWPHTPTGQREPHKYGRGHAKCECGWLSVDLPSNTARQRHHADHKRQVREARQ